MGLGTSSKKSGKRHVPTAESCRQVCEWIANGDNLKEVGEKLGTSPRTVRKYYSKQLENYVPEQRSTVPPYQVSDKDREIVEGLCLVGLSRDKIAKNIGVSRTTLEKYYREELDHYKDRKMATIARNLTEAAEFTGLKPNANAFFILKARAGWRDNDYKEVAQNFTELMKTIAEKLPD